MLPSIKHARMLYHCIPSQSIAFISMHSWISNSRNDSLSFPFSQLPSHQHTTCVSRRWLKSWPHHDVLKNFLAVKFLYTKARILS
jgi:hypothetical protein